MCSSKTWIIYQNCWIEFLLINWKRQRLKRQPAEDLRRETVLLTPNSIWIFHVFTLTHCNTGKVKTDGWFSSYLVNVERICFKKNFNPLINTKSGLNRTSANHPEICNLTQKTKVILRCKFRGDLYMFLPLNTLN